MRLMPPVKVNGEWRVGMVSTKYIYTGEEILYDYGRQPNAPEWLRRRVCCQIFGECIADV